MIRRIKKRSAKKRARVRAAKPDLGMCEFRIAGVCQGRATDEHHKLPRSRGGDDSPENKMKGCRACHCWCHEHPRLAALMGFTVSKKWSAA